MKRRTTKFISLLLSLTLIAVMAATAPFSVSAETTDETETAEYFTSGDFEYQFSEGTGFALPKGAIMITGYTGHAADLSIPDKLDGYSVACISFDAFANCNDIVNLTIPDSVIQIASAAFDGCKNLKSVHIEGDNLSYIWDSAFARCASLTEITLPNKLKEIYNSTFEDCTSLKSIIIPEGATSIGSRAFKGCESLENIAIPESVTSIGWYTFQDCKSLESISIPDNVVVIGGYAFSGCTSLKNIVLPKKLINIGKGTFLGCTSLTDIIIVDNSYLSSVDGVLFTKDQTQLLIYPEGKTDKSYSIPDSVTSINYDAFSRCTSLVSVTIPDSVISIGSSAFSDCASFKAVTVPESVETIGAHSFGYSSYYDSENDETAFNKTESFTIFGKTGSAAEIYANENEFTFVDLDNQSYAHKDEGSSIEVIAKAQAQLSVKAVDDERSLNNASIALGYDKSIISLYDISLTKDGEKVQHEGMAQAKIPCDNENAKVFRIEEDGTKTDMNAVYKDGFMLFYTEHFSLYAVAAEKEQSDYQFGDVNLDGNVNVKDATLIQRIVVEEAGLAVTEAQRELADINADGTISVKDATALQIKIVNT